MDKEYSEQDVENLFEEASKKGAILALLHFDAHSKEKEEVRNALVELISRLSNEKMAVYCKGRIEDVVDREEEDGTKMYSTFAEVKVLFVNLEGAMNICLKYAPVTLEILKPGKLQLNADELQTLLLNASSVSQHYTNYFMQKLLKPEEFNEFQKKLKARAELGKKKIDEAEKKAGQEDGGGKAEAKKNEGEEKPPATT